MAEEEAEKKAAAAPAAEGGDSGGAKAPSPLVPILIVAVLVPAMTFGIMQFVFMPKIKHMFDSVQARIAETEGEEGEAHDQVEATEAGHKGPEKGPTQTYEFEDIVANLAQSMQSRYIRVSFMVEGSDPNFTQTIEQNRIKLIDASLGILSSLNNQSIQKPGIKNIVRADLVSSLNQNLGVDLIEDLYFSQFVVQ